MIELLHPPKPAQVLRSEWGVFAGTCAAVPVLCGVTLRASKNPAYVVGNILFFVWLLGRALMATYRGAYYRTRP